MENEAGELVLVGGVEQFLSASNRKAAAFDPASRTWSPRPTWGQVPPLFSWTAFTTVALSAVESAETEAPARFIVATGGHGARSVNRAVRAGLRGVQSPASPLRHRLAPPALLRSLGPLPPASVHRFRR